MKLKNKAAKIFWKQFKNRLGKIRCYKCILKELKKNA